MSKAVCKKLIIIPIIITIIIIIIKKGRLKQCIKMQNFCVVTKQCQIHDSVKLIFLFYLFIFCVQGRCISSAVFSVSSGRVAPDCRCCSALETRTVVIPLHCHDGSTQSYNMTVITACDCKSKHCG